MCLPELLPVQCIHTDTTGDKCTPLVRNPLQRPLYTIENVIEDSRRQCHRYRCPGSFHKLSRTQSGSLLIHLYSRPVLIKGNDFANQLLLSHMDHLRHLKHRLPFQVDNRAIDAIYFFCPYVIHPSHLPGTGTSDIHSPVHP